MAVALVRIFIEDLRIPWSYHSKYMKTSLLGKVFLTIHHQDFNSFLIVTEFSERDIGDLIKSDFLKILIMNM